VVGVTFYISLQLISVLDVLVRSTLLRIMSSTLFRSNLKNINIQLNSG